MVSPDREKPIIIVRKKVYAAGHHGGAWKVAFADFMTSLMALFLVMWIVTQSSDVRSAIAGYFADPLGRGDEFGSSIIPGVGAQAASVRPLPQRQLLDIRIDRLQQAGTRIRERVHESASLQQLEQYIDVELTDDGLRIELLESAGGVFFDRGGTALSADGHQALALVAAELRDMTNPVVIEGHTDAAPYRWRRGYSNWELSTDRANAARRILTENGVPPARILEIRGHADRDLRNADRPLAAENRRVTITLLVDYNLAADGASAPETGS